MDVNFENMEMVMNNINIGLNLVSVMGALALGLMIIVALRYDDKVMDRISIRFTLAMSIVELIKALALLTLSLTRVDGLYCFFISHVVQWASLSYILLNVAMAFNLKLVLLMGKLFDPKWERWYWLVSILVPVGLTLSHLGHNQNFMSCEYNDPFDKVALLWQWMTYLSWTVIGCVYCGGVAIAALFRINCSDCVLSRVQTRDVALLRDAETHNRNYSWLNTRGLAYRMVILCSIPALTQIWYPVLRMFEYYSTSELVVVLRWLSLLGSALPGFLNFTLFLTDPAFNNVIQATIKKRQDDKICKSTKPQISIKELTPPVPTLCPNSLTNCSLKPQSPTCHNYPISPLQVRRASFSSATPVRRNSLNSLNSGRGIGGSGFLAGTNSPLSQLVKGL